MPAGYPLVARSEVTIDDLAGEAMISNIDDEARTFLNHDVLLREAGLAVDTAITGHASVAVCGLVSRGQGIALLKPFSAAIWTNNGVVTRCFRPRLTYAFTAGLKPDTFQSGVMSEVVQVARETFAEFAPKDC